MSDASSAQVRPQSHGDARYLAAHLYAAEVNGAAVLLDLLSLQYYAVDAQSLSALRANVVDWPCSRAAPHGRDSIGASAASSLDSLTAKGFLSSSRPERLFSHRGTAAITACHPVWDMRASPSETLRMLCRLLSAYVTTMVYIRRKHVAPLLTRIAPLGSIYADQCVAPSKERLVTLVTLYAKLRVWFYTAKHRCLFDSLVLLAVLQKYAIPARLTIGVSSRPFSAHAWIQVSDCVIDDSVEHVREYTPILVA